MISNMIKIRTILIGWLIIQYIILDMLEVLRLLPSQACCYLLLSWKILYTNVFREAYFIFQWTKIAKFGHRYFGILPITIFNGQTTELLRKWVRLNFYKHIYSWTIFILYNHVLTRWLFFNLRPFDKTKIWIRKSRI